MRKPASYYLLVIFLLSFINVAFSATPANKVVIVPGVPPITQYAIDCHIKTLEFILKTRMTVAQKNAFLRAIKRECKRMDTEDKNNFLEVVELVKSMNTMNDKQREIVRSVLEQDFQESASSTPDDPASKLFLRLKNDANKNFFEIKKEGMTIQSFEALVEYLAFIQNPDDPARVSKNEKAIIKTLIRKNYTKLNDDNKQTLDGFQFTWYMIRAAWQYAEERKKIEWRKDFKRCGVQLGKKLRLKSIIKSISTDTFGQLLDDAVKMKLSPAEWSQPSQFRIW